MQRNDYNKQIQLDDKLIVNIKSNPILGDINFSLDKGIIAFLSGKNGSGKTTLLKEIAGINENDKMSEKIGFFLNNFNLNLSDQTVLSHLIIPLEMLQRENPCQTAINILKELKIEHLMHKKIIELSYSQKKMVSFAYSVIHNPNIILIDNLFDSLGYEMKEAVIKFLIKLKEEKNAIVIYTSNNKEDIFFSDITIVLNNCKLSIVSTTLDILQDEKKISKLTIPIPFMVELSYKLKLYGLVNDLILSQQKMVDELWK